MDFDVVVVGGGISGLTAALELTERRPDWSILVLEKEPAAGGKVRSSTVGDFTFDWGPNGFQPAPATLELVSRLGLQDRLVAASDRARFRYLYRDGGLRRVPLKPQEFLASDLLTPIGKARALLEPLLALRRSGGEEESVHSFVSRHFGFEVASVLAGAMVMGVTAGDARRLSVDATFPAMRRLESEHGSLLRAMAASRGRRPPGPALYSFAPDGMGALTRALAERLGDRLRSSAEASRLERLPDGGFELILEGGERLRAVRVVLATPAFVSARLLEGMLPGAAAELSSIAYADVVVHALGYHRADVAHPLDGFGFLAPRGEGLRSLGVLWSSSLFEGRSPAGTVLLRAIGGGTIDPDFIDLGEEEALESVRRDLRLSLGITAAPLFRHRLAIPRAIPQYELGHRRLVERAMAAVREVGGLALGGNAYNGVAVNDCIRDAVRVADEVIGGPSTRERAP